MKKKQKLPNTTFPLQKDGRPFFFSRRGGPTAPTALGHPPAMGAPLLLGHGGASLPLRLQSSEDRLKECLWLPGSPGGSSFQSKNSEMELVEVTII